MIADYQPQRPIIVLGNVSNGKTTFLRYLRMVEASKTLTKYIQLEIDFPDRLSEGKEVADYIYRSIEEQLQKPPYNLDIISDSLIRAALGNDLKRFRGTPVAKAYKHDSPEYIKSELEFINVICADKHEFYKRMFVNMQAQR